MKKYLLFVVLILLTSCKSYYNEPKEIQYDCVLEYSEFFVSIPEILADEGYQINSVDTLRGFLIAEKKIEHKGKETILTLSIRRSKDNNTCFITPSSITLPREKNQIKYYDETHITKKLKKDLQRTLKRIKYFCKGPYFPNQP